MSDINNEIEEVAEKIEKSTVDYNEKLFETIKNLGSEGLRKAMDTLNEDDLKILKSALSEMKKSAKLKDAPIGKKIVSKVTDSKVETEKMDDDEDEKLVKEKNKDVKPQGDASPEGFEGQVIKSEEEESSEDLKKKVKNQLVGGKGDKIEDKSVCPKQLAAGIKIEMEHTKDEAKAKEIALDHLAEAPTYYINDKGEDRLHEMEEEANAEVKKAEDEEEKSMTYDPKLQSKEDLKKECGEVKKSDINDLVEELIKGRGKDKQKRKSRGSGDSFDPLRALANEKLSPAEKKALNEKHAKRLENYKKQSEEAEAKNVKDKKEAKEKNPNADMVRREKMIEQGKIIDTNRNLYKSNDINDLVEEELSKGGPGSRGGKVIGTTRSGKPIYDTANHSAHSKFERKDHIDAQRAHSEIISQLQDDDERAHSRKQRDAHGLEANDMSGKRRAKAKADMEADKQKDRDYVKRHGHDKGYKRDTEADDYVKKSLIEEIQEDLEKARSHKYIRKEGKKYIYDEKKSKSSSKEATSRQKELPKGWSIKENNSGKKFTVYNEKGQGQFSGDDKEKTIEKVASLYEKYSDDDIVGGSKRKDVKEAMSDLFSENKPSKEVFREGSVYIEKTDINGKDRYQALDDSGNAYSEMVDSKAEAMKQMKAAKKENSSRDSVKTPENQKFFDSLSEKEIRKRQKLASEQKDMIINNFSPEEKQAVFSGKQKHEVLERLMATEDMLMQAMLKKVKENKMKKSETKDINDMVEALEKGGEGSKGGKVIGHTKSGNPIYAARGQGTLEVHNKFSPADHSDASEAHNREAKNHKKLMLEHKASGNKEKQRESRNAWMDHANKADKHRKAAGAETKIISTPSGSVPIVGSVKKSKEELLTLKAKVIKSFEEAGTEYTNDLVKGRMKEILIEAMTAVEESQQKVEKSVNWNTPNLLKANTLGRNFNYSVNNHYDEMIKALDESKEENLKKSEKTKKDLDVNDMIEKGMDKSKSDIENEELLKKSE